MGKRAKRSSRKSAKSSSTTVYKGPMVLYKPMAPKVFICEGVTGTTNILTNVSGNISNSYLLGDFGFSGGPTHLVTLPFAATSSFQVQILACRLQFQPFYGPSIATGVGCGTMVTVHDGSLSPVTTATIMQCLGWHPFYNSRSSMLDWRAQNVSESLWISGNAVSFSTAPQPGFVMAIASVGGPVSSQIGLVTFRFVVRVREQ